MIISAAAYEGMFVPWLFLLGASALSLVYAGLRIPVSAFLGPRMPGGEVREAPANMLVAMGIAAALCILLGIWPALLYDLLPRSYEYHPYTAEHLLTQMQLLVLAALAFALAWRAGLFPRDLPGIHLDVDWFWRRPAARLIGGSLRGLLLGWGTVAERSSSAGLRLIELLYRQHGPAGRLARTRPSGSTALWMTVLLAAFLVFSFF
jgi:multicomponent Na+:H+ antiporter subunit D